MRLALACLLVCACAGKSEVSAPYEGALSGVDPPLDAITHRLSRVRERLRLRGYHELPHQARAFVVEGHASVLPIDLPSGACSTFVALGSASLRDLRVSVLDSEGLVLAAEEFPGEAALVHVCPQTEARSMPAYLALDSRDGAGTIGLAELTSAPGEGDGFEGVFDDVLAPREPFADVEERLASGRSVLRARGFSADGASNIASVAEGGSVRATHTFEAGRCYLVIARAAPTVGDADLFAFDSAGVEVARDIGAGSEPSFERCPHETELLAIEARAFAGRGALGIQVLVGPSRDDARDERASVPAALDPTLPPGDPSLSVGVTAAALGPLGFAAPVFVVEHARIAPGDVVTHEVIVGPGCALVMAAASSDQIDLDLYLADASGRELDADTSVRSSAVVHACESAPSVRRVAVKGYGREGGYSLAIVRAPAAIDSIEGLRASEAEAPLRTRGFAPRESAEIDLAEHSPVMRTLAVERGRCVGVVVGGGVGVRDVDLTLSDASGALLASDTAPTPYASATACANGEAGLVVSYEVVAFRGAGRAIVSVLDDEVRDAGE